jgi:hypothetical protein
MSSGTVQHNQTQGENKQQVPISQTMFSELMAAPGVASLLQHPGFQAYQAYLSNLRGFFNAFLIYNSKDERQDMFFKGKINCMDELINLPTAIKQALNTKSEVV